MNKIITAFVYSKISTQWIALKISSTISWGEKGKFRLLNPFMKRKKSCEERCYETGATVRNIATVCSPFKFVNKHRKAKISRIVNKIHCNQEQQLSETVTCLCKMHLPKNKQPQQIHNKTCIRQQKQIMHNNLTVRHEYIVSKITFTCMHIDKKSTTQTSVLLLLF